MTERPATVDDMARFWPTTSRKHLSEVLSTCKSGGVHVTTTGELADGLTMSSAGSNPQAPGAWQMLADLGPSAGADERVPVGLLLEPAQSAAGTSEVREDAGPPLGAIRSAAGQVSPTAAALAGWVPELCREGQARRADRCR